VITALKAPMPYAGGKSTVAQDVWNALGNPKHYIEPFFGSGAVLLQRPNYNPQTMVETVNDADGHICNVWRALQGDPDAVAKVCDFPVNHADLMARKKVLNANTERLLENLVADPEWYDAKLAGYWIWSACCSIGTGLICPNQIPHLTGAGMGVHALGKRPHLANAGRGVHALGKRPHLANAGRGVHKPSLSEQSTAVVKDVREPYNTPIYDWFRRLSERLRNVRVVCGDWTRVCGGNWQDKMGTVGIFFDPPYGTEATRDLGIYAVDSLTVAGDVRRWCLERGDKPSYRIVLAGYYEEHEELLKLGWTHKKWKASGGYANTGNGQGKVNRFREALFFSPYCLKQGLF